MTRTALRLAPTALGILSALTVVTTGCNNDGNNSTADMAGSAITCKNTQTYPPGPYGTTVGSTIKDLTLRVQTGANGTFADKKLSDYRAECLAAKLKVLAIVGAAYWCAPCKAEQPQLVAEWNDYQTKKSGVAYLDVVIEDNNHMPASEMLVKDWATQYNIPFDVAADPNKVMSPYFDTNTFPNQLVIKLDDMSIAAFAVGANKGVLTGAIDEALK